ncbi:hypothetical protein ACPCTO_27480 [Streptomyces olivoreticuli]
MPTGKGPVRVTDANPDAAPASGCRSFADSAADVRIDVLSSGAYGDTVRATKS